MTFAPENSTQFFRSGRTANAVRPGPRRSRSTLFRADLCVLCRRFCCPRIARVNKQDAGRQHGPDALMSFWFGWGGAVPPREGARLPLHAAHPFRLRECPCVLVLLVRARRHGTSARRHTRWCHESKGRTWILYTSCSRKTKTGKQRFVHSATLITPSTKP